MAQGGSFIGRLDRSGVPLLVARLLVGGWFIYLAIMKLQDPVAFLKVINTYQMIPSGLYPLLNSMAVVLPWVEITCGLALILGVWIRAAAITIIGMLLVFYPPLISRSLELLATPQFSSYCDVKFDCGCGTGEVFICNKLAENTILLLLSAYGILSRSRKFRLPNLLGRKQAAELPAPTAEPSS